MYSVIIVKHKNHSIELQAASLWTHLLWNHGIVQKMNMIMMLNLRTTTTDARFGTRDIQETCRDVL